VQEIDTIMLRPEKSVHVNIMDEYWNRDRIVSYQAWLQQRGISHSINTIDYTQQTRSIPLLPGIKNLNND
jgi:hypothetical protein